jgi:Tol biopolymer transport system component
MFWKPLDGSAPEETLLAIDKSADAWFFTPNGNELLFAVGTGISDNNIGLLPLNDRSNPKMLFPPQLNVEWAVLSPDGKWIAFNGDESGRSDIAVTPDGKGFILIREAESQSGPNEMRVVVHWPEELKQKVAVGK